MNLEFTIVIILMSFSLGYIFYWAVAEMHKVWRMYVMGKKLQERWDGDIVDIMTGEKNE